MKATSATSNLCYKDIIIIIVIDSNAQERQYVLRQQVPRLKNISELIRTHGVDRQT